MGGGWECLKDKIIIVNKLLASSNLVYKGFRVETDFEI